MHTLRSLWMWASQPDQEGDRETADCLSCLLTRMLLWSPNAPQAGGKQGAGRLFQRRHGHTASFLALYCRAEKSFLEI